MKLLNLALPIALLALLVTITACTPRTRNNPLDPSAANYTSGLYYTVSTNTTNYYNMKWFYAAAGGANGSTETINDYQIATIGTTPYLYYTYLAGTAGALKQVNSGSWALVSGSPTGGGFYANMATTSTGKIALLHGMSGFQLDLFNGTSWNSAVTVTNEAHNAGPAFSFGVAFDENQNVLMAFPNPQWPNYMTVRKWTTILSTVQLGFTSYTPEQISYRISKSATNFVGYYQPDQRRVKVECRADSLFGGLFNGTEPDSAENNYDPAIELDDSGDLVMAYIHSPTKKIRVKRYKAGLTWDQPYGSVEFPETGTATNVALAVVSNVPYVFFQSSAEGNKVVCYTRSSGAWVKYGDNVSVTGTPGKLRATSDSSGNIFLALYENIGAGSSFIYLKSINNQLVGSTNYAVTNFK